MRIGRRTFVCSAAMAALTAPFLATFRGVSHAGGTRAARRLVIFFTPNGTSHRYWRPTGSGSTFSFPAGSILEPLTPVRQHCTVLDGIDFMGVSNHEQGLVNMLTGGGGAGTLSMGMSLDQYIAGRIGRDSRFASLELGVQTSAWGGNTQTRMSYSGPGRFVPPDDDPTSVYRRLFGGSSSAPMMVDAVLARRRSVLDLVRAEVTDLQGRIGAEERPKLEAHLDAIRRVETGLMGAGTGSSPASCSTPPAVMDLDFRQNDNLPRVGRAQMDLLVAALACGMTKVGSIQWTHTVAPHVFSWLRVSEGHHALSHMVNSNGPGEMDFVRTERWYTEQFAYLVGRLAEMPEPGGTGRMIDHSLVLWAKELGDGQLHECLSVPFVLAGGAGGRLMGNRFVKFDNVTDGPPRAWMRGMSQPHQRLLVTVCQAMGLDNPTFGNPMYGTGPLPGVLS